MLTKYFSRKLIDNLKINKRALSALASHLRNIYGKTNWQLVLEEYISQSSLYRYKVFGIFGFNINFNS